MKIRLLLALLLSPIFCFSQSFIVTPDGLRDSESDNSYVVIDQENKTAEELYNTTIRYINDLMENPNDAIKSTVKNDYIRFSVAVPAIVAYSNMGFKIQIEGYFDVELRFKDNKIRYEIVSLRLPAKTNDRELEMIGSKWKGYVLFDNKGKLIKKNEKLQLELYFNALLSTYITYLNDGTKKDDW